MSSPVPRPPSLLSISTLPLALCAPAEPEPRMDPRVDRGSRDTMIYAPCVHADLLMRAPTALVSFLPREANGLGKRRGGRTKIGYLLAGWWQSHGKQTVLRPFRDEERMETGGFGKKLGTRSKGGAKPLIDSLVRGFLFRSMAFPSNRRAAYLRLGACASCPTMAKPRRLFLDIDTNAFVSVPEMADSRSTRLGTREQPRTRSAIFPGRSVRATPAAGSAS